MPDYLVELNPKKNIDRKGMGRLKHPLQAMIAKARRFGQVSVKYNTDEQSLLVANFDGEIRDLNQFVNKLAANAVNHDPRIPISPEIRPISPEETQYQADTLELTEEIESHQETLIEYESRIDALEEQNKWCTEQIEHLEEFRGKEQEISDLTKQLHSEKTNLSERLIDSQKGFNAIQEEYGRIKSKNKKLQNQNSDLEQKLDQSLQKFVTKDPKQLRIEEVAESATALQYYEQKLQEEGLEDITDVFKITKMTLVEYVNSELHENFQSEELIKEIINIPAFEETTFYGANFETHNAALKTLNFLETLRKQGLTETLPGGAKQIYDIMESNLPEYKRTIAEFESERKSYNDLRTSASEITAVIKDYEKAKSLLQIIQNPPIVSMYVRIGEKEELLYIPSGSDNSILRHESLESMGVFLPEPKKESDFSIYSLNVGKGAEIAMTIKKNIAFVLPKCRIIVEQEL